MELSLSSAFAYQNYFCPAHKVEVVINNKVLRDRIKYVHTKSYRKLSEAEDSDELTGHTLGMFSPRIFDDTIVETVDENNDGCYEKIVVNLTVDFDPMIYIAKELAVGSPAYNYVFWHETEHAGITIENNKRYLSYLKQELERYISGIKVYYPSSPSDIEASGSYVLNKITSVVTENIDKLNSMVERVNDDFDEKEHKYDAWLDSILTRLENGMGV